MSIVGDIRFALRTFSRAPLFTLIALLSLAFGIGANTAIFSLTDQLLVRSLPVVNPEQLVLLSAQGRHYGSNQGWNRISYPMYSDFRDHNVAFSGMFCFRELDMSLAYNGSTERVAGEAVSGNYFPVLGVKPVLGRLFTASDDLYQNANPIVVLSYNYWLNRFAGDPKVIGRKLLINGFAYTVVGVVQQGFSGTDPGSSPQVRVPVSMAKRLTGYLDPNDRRSRWVTAFGRLKPGFTIAQAKASLQPYFHQILQMEVQQAAFAKAAPDMKAAFLRMSMDVLPGAKGRSYLRRQFSKPLLVLVAIVGLVLLIACANVANLLIARATARQKEIAVRLAMGSSRGRIIRQLLVESVLLAFAGGAAGLLLAVTRFCVVEIASAEFRANSALACTALASAFLQYWIVFAYGSALWPGSGIAVDTARFGAHVEGPSWGSGRRRLYGNAQGSGGVADCALVVAADQRRTVHSQSAEPEGSRSGLQCCEPTGIQD